MSNNHKELEGRQVKKCPFLKDWCIGDECAIHVSIARNTPVGMQRVPTCGVEAMIMMLSELNQKTVGPAQQKKPEIILPFMGRS